jgi:hypothetical protein
MGIYESVEHKGLRSLAPISFQTCLRVRKYWRFAMTFFKGHFHFIMTSSWPVYYNVLIVLGLSLSVNAFALPDLSVKLWAPSSAIAGEDIGSKLKLVVYNAGNQTAPGTQSKVNGYIIDLFITKGVMPTGYARFNEKYFDGVLLKGGRYSDTISLLSGERTVYKSSALLPVDIKAGKYQLCARVDPGGKLSERNEANNTSCVNLKVVGRQKVASKNWQVIKMQKKGRKLQQVLPTLAKRLPKPVSTPKHISDSTATRTVLKDGSLLITYIDGSQRRLRPHSEIEYVTPEGLIIGSTKIEVPSDELPKLPSGLKPWGGFVASKLMLILNNILTESELAAYRQTEKDMDYYDLIDWRLRCISFLTTQELK